MNSEGQAQRVATEQDSQNKTDLEQQALEQSSAASTDNQANLQTDSGSGAGESHVELKYRSLKNVSTAKFAKGLGVFSIALGLAEVLAPAQLGGLIGVSNRHRALLPVLGLREIAHGIAILRQAKPTESVWTRVGGDAVDLAYLGWAFMSPETNKRRLTGATAAVLGVAALDILCAQQLSSQKWSEADRNPASPTTVGQSSGRSAPNA